MLCWSSDALLTLVRVDDRLMVCGFDIAFSFLQLLSLFSPPLYNDNNNLRSTIIIFTQGAAVDYSNVIALTASPVKCSNFIISTFRQRRRGSIRLLPCYLRPINVFLGRTRRCAVRTKSFLNALTRKSYGTACLRGCCLVEGKSVNFRGHSKGKPWEDSCFFDFTDVAFLRSNKRN